MSVEQVRAEEFVYIFEYLVPARHLKLSKVELVLAKGANYDDENYIGLR